MSFFVVGISDAMRQDFSLMKEMSVYTHVAPNERFQQLNAFLSDIQRREEAKEELDKWQIKLDEQLLELQGRTIEAESIVYKDVRPQKNHFFFVGDRFLLVQKSIRYNPLEADWSREGRSLAHLSARHLDRWLLLHSPRDVQLARSFVDALYKVSLPFGMRVDFPKMFVRRTTNERTKTFFSSRIELPNDRAETFIRAIENNADPQMDLVCCILTNNRKDRYDAIKKVLCVDCPLPSQVARGEMNSGAPRRVKDFSR